MIKLAGPLEKFLREYLPRDKGASQHTIESYALCFKLLIVFAAEKHDTRPCRLEINHLDIATILMFLEYLETQRGNSVNTRNVRLAAIKAFFRFVEFRYPGHLDLASQVREIPVKKGILPLVGYLDSCRNARTAQCTGSENGDGHSRPGDAVPDIQRWSAGLGTGWTFT